MPDVRAVANLVPGVYTVPAIVPGIYIVPAIVPGMLAGSRTSHILVVPARIIINPFSSKSWWPGVSPVDI